MTEAELAAATECRLHLAAIYADPLTRAIGQYGVTNVPEFVAQVAYESDLFESLEEGLYYRTAQRLLEVFPRDFRSLEDAAAYVGRPEATANRVYANQNGNGDEASGDGWRYRGRGLIQLTGRANYARYGYADDPDALLRTIPACDAAARYWVDRGCNGLTDVTTITRRVNGGLNGLSVRVSLTERARRVLTDDGRWVRAYAELMKVGH